MKRNLEFLVNFFALATFRVKGLSLYLVGSFQSRSQGFLHLYRHIRLASYVIYFGFVIFCTFLGCLYCS